MRASISGERVMPLSPRFRFIYWEIAARVTPSILAASLCDSPI
jgi:hypothetical protein